MIDFVAGVGRHIITDAAVLGHQIKAKLAFVRAVVAHAINR